jgi:hypothetical protein
MNVNQLKMFLTRDKTIEDMVVARVQLKALAQGYADAKLSVPAWIVEKVSLIDLEIAAAVRAEKMATLAKYEARRSELMTTSEKRNALDAEIAALRASLM